MWWPSTLIRGLAAALLLLGLAACGFQPLYQGGDGGGESAAGSTSLSELQQVQIAPIGDRLGQQLHNKLRNLMNPQGQPGNPAYRLQIELTDSESRTNLAGDAIASRVVRRLYADWRVVEPGTGETLFSGRSRSFSSYDVLDQPYATLAGKRDAGERGLQQLAQNIHARVAAFLARDRDAAGQ